MPNWLKILCGAVCGTLLGIWLARNYCQGAFESFAVSENAVDAQAQAVVLTAKTAVVTGAGAFLGCLLGAASVLAVRRLWGMRTEAA